MKKTMCAILTAGVMAFAMSLTAAAQTPAPAPKLRRVQHKEAHPEMRAAITHLREAKNNLEHAAHDFGGHRAKALEHVNEALAECERALAFDKK